MLRKSQRKDTAYYDILHNSHTHQASRNFTKIILMLAKINQHYLVMKASRKDLHSLMGDLQPKARNLSISWRGVNRVIKKSFLNSSQNEKSACITTHCLEIQIYRHVNFFFLSYVEVEAFSYNQHLKKSCNSDLFSSHLATNEQHMADRENVTWKLSKSVNILASNNKTNKAIHN